MNKNKNYMSFLIPILLLILLYQFVGDYFAPNKNIGIDVLVKSIQEDKIEKIKTIGSKVEGRYKDKNTFTAELPGEFQSTFYDNYLKEKVESGKIKYEAEKVPAPSVWVSVLPSVLIMGGGVLLLFFLMNRSAGGNSQAMNFGRSRASLNKDTGKRITFSDVAGLKEEKEELYEIVDFLKDPRKYVTHGARIPTGVLLVGPPGTGKTYISKAVAGEAKVPFYSISGSDFVEMFVGVGASRVRDMFKEAKKNAPCIIFIDEIDAVGRRRGAGLGGGHDEREQTLNQLLVEMDGFETNEGIIMIAATNRPDILDPALLRPGRFDRTIQISLPDVQERYEVLKVHTKNKHLAKEVDLRDIAKTTAGFSPAELENITNEAALLAARYGKPEITSDIFEEATIRVVAGPEKKSRVVIEKERELTAYHEAGHAVVTHFLPDMDPVHMITIIPRGSAGGFTSFIPEEDRSYSTKGRMINEIVSLLGGRAAEELVLDDISTGASNDIERATKIARAMVTAFGMSEKLGPIQYRNNSGDVFLGRDYTSGDNHSEKVAIEIDEEVRQIIGGAYTKAKELLSKNIEFLHELSKALLEKETLRKEDFISIAMKYDSSLDIGDVIKAKNEVVGE